METKSDIKEVQQTAAPPLPKHLFLREQEQRLAAQQKMMQDTPAPPPQWTLWEEVESMSGALLKASSHCQQLAADIKQGLRELQRILGNPKQ